jgi:protocatechuate 4,5-dioxygenase alpha chain
MPISDEYEDIPGTVVFDSHRARQGYHLNMFCMSLMKPENRAAFKGNEAEYLTRFPMTEAQRDAVLKRDWNEMIRLGGNVYYTGKLGATDGLSFQQMAAKMSAPSLEQYVEMMIKGGRSVEGNRSKSEWKNRG